eukprot:2700941-Pleurochrysis_carterae.AAC.3
MALALVRPLALVLALVLVLGLLEPTRAQQITRAHYACTFGDEVATSVSTSLATAASAAAASSAASPRPARIKACGREK